MRTLTNDRVIARSDNVVLVDFSRKPEPPAPRFPGAQEQTVFDQIDCS
jgi:hypothetical protein